MASHIPAGYRLPVWQQVRANYGDGGKMMAFESAATKFGRLIRAMVAASMVAEAGERSTTNRDAIGEPKLSCPSRWSAKTRRLFEMLLRRRSWKAPPRRPCRESHPSKIWVVKQAMRGGDGWNARQR